MELLELKLSFLWVVLFAPIMPAGVIPTLLARIIESNSDLAKMLFVRRRSFPEPGKTARRLQLVFMASAVAIAAAWSAMLSAVTYNDDLWKEDKAAAAAAVSAGVGWVVTAVAL